MTHPNLLGKKFPEHSLNIDLIEKLEEETDWFNKLHDANFVKWWWANPMNPGLNHNGGCTIITNQSYINFYSHFEIPSKRINKNILIFWTLGWGVMLKQTFSVMGWDIFHFWNCVPDNTKNDLSSSSSHFPQTMACNGYKQRKHSNKVSI